MDNPNWQSPLLLAQVVGITSVEEGFEDVPTFDHHWRQAFPDVYVSPASTAPYSIGARVRVICTPRMEDRALRGVVARVRWRGSYVKDDNTNGWTYLVQPIDQERLVEPVEGVVIEQASWNTAVKIPLYAFHDTELAPAPRGARLPELRDPDEDERFFERVDLHMERALRWRRGKTHPYGTTYTGYVRLDQKWDDFGERLSGEHVVVVHEPKIERFLLRHYEYPRPDHEERYRHTWGYLGTGPRLLAFALLADVLGETVTYEQFTAGASLAMTMRQDFKEEVIAYLPTHDKRNAPSWTLSADMIAGWINGWVYANSAYRLRRWAEEMATFEQQQEATRAELAEAEEMATSDN